MRIPLTRSQGQLVRLSRELAEARVAEYRQMIEREAREVLRPVFEELGRSDGAFEQVDGEWFLVVEDDEETASC